MRGEPLDIRGKRLKRSNESATGFTSSIGFDAPIARHVIRINTAHMLTLIRGGEVKKGIGAECLKFLLEAAPETTTGQFEDIHQAIEQSAVDRLGVEKAGFLNLGKSRNDQVASAIRMELRERIILLLTRVNLLQESLLGVVKRDGRTVIPGFTHLQHERVNLSPMGAAALAGTSVNIDRRLIASLLGFTGIIDNSMDAVSSRDFAVEALSSCEMLMIELSRIAEEIILWSSKEFGFVEVADEYAASSSIMPQKKNPVTAELVRAKCGSVLGSLQAVCTILKGLPYSYNLDLQEVTPHLWAGLANTQRSVEIIDGTISTLIFNPKALSRSMEGDYSTATSLANYLVKSSGLSFREAHSLVGEVVRKSVEEAIPFFEAARELPNLSKKIPPLDEKTLQSILDPTALLKSIVTAGGANPQFIPGGVERRLRLVHRNRSRLAKLEGDLKLAELSLLRNANSLLGEVRN
ncbi:MAG: argininosuccinate lyase [Thaumarchaeota archaeon]|nr:MAG: argininosuccinate lyase [Nitrososphaerota archaeon]